MQRREVAGKGWRVPSWNAVAIVVGESLECGDVTRQRLLAASSSLIVERGWSAVTTRAVAERAGVNQALVHYYEEEWRRWN